MSNRTNQPGGPAHATWNAKTFQPAKAWQLKPQLKVTALETGLYGVVGDTEDHPLAELTMQPIAFTSGLATLLAILFPYQTPKHGPLLFPSVDLPLLIKTDEGAASKTLTFPAAAITKPPQLQYAAGKPFFGDMTMTMLRANNSVATTAGSFSSSAVLTYTAPGYDPTGEVNSTYVYAWGGVAPFDSFETDPEGVKLEVAYGWDELPEANHGVRQFRLKSVTAQARFVPTSVTAEDFLAALAMDGASAGRGKRMVSRGLPLTVTGNAAGAPLLTIPKAVPISGDVKFGDPRRIGEVIMHAQWDGASALFTPGVVA